MVYNKFKFIVFEGIDGSGKSTLCDMLYEYLVSLGLPAVKGQEPTDGKWGRKIRELLSGSEPPPVEEQMRLFLLDRKDDTIRNIIPAVNAGRIMVMDRYYFSNAAYQGAMGLQPHEIIAENKKMGFPEPDRVYLVDIDPETALQRIKVRDNEKSDFFEKKNFLDRARQIYLSIADERFLILDGNASPAEIMELIKKDIQRVCN